jgi:hypothetical protein
MLPTNFPNNEQLKTYEMTLHEISTLEIPHRSMELNTQLNNGETSKRDYSKL